MKTEDYVLYGLLALAIIGLVLAFTGFSIPSGAATGTGIKETGLNAPSSGFRTIDSGSTGNGEVAVGLTPKGFKDGKFIVELSANTHSVSLDNYNLKEIVALEFESKSIKPVSAPKLSGHHNSGQLVFDIGKELDNFKITVRDLPDIQERVFEWP